MTRAEALALRAAGGLRENCVVVLHTDTPTIGTAGNTSTTEIELNPVNATEFGQTARVLTTFAPEAWPGVYDLAANTITELRDDFGNTVKDVDAGGATVHSQFPWHLGSATLRDNYVEDSTLIGWDTQVGAVTNNRVVGSTVNLTGKTAGTVGDSQFTNTTVISGGAFLGVSLSTVRGGNLQLGAGVAVGTVALTRADLNSVTVTRDATATGGLSVTGSQVTNSTMTQGAGAAGSITVTDSEVGGASTLHVDAGSGKSISVSVAELQAYAVRTQDSGGTGPTLSRGQFFGKPPVADSLLVRGVGGGGVSISSSVVDGASTAGAGQASIDVNGAASSALIQNADIRTSRITVGAGAGAFQSTGAEYASAVINALSPGRLTINQTTVRGGSINHAAAATESLDVTGGRVEGGGLIELLSGGRGLNVTATDVLGGIIRQTTVNAASGANSNRVLDSRVTGTGRIIFSETNPAGQAGSSVNRSTVRGSSLGGGVDGVLTITGVSGFVIVDAVDIQGVATLTDVPSGALSGGTAFHDVRVGPAGTLTYTAGDAVAKQIRNINIEHLSTLTLTDLTGTAGAGLGDVFGVNLRGQSTMTVTGARVAGQPVRNVTVEQGGTLNVAANGSVQRFRVAGGATLNTGAFVHFDSEMSLAATKTLTAANINRLANKAFDDMI